MFAYRAFFAVSGFYFIYKGIDGLAVGKAQSAISKGVANFASKSDNEMYFYINVILHVAIGSYLIFLSVRKKK